MILRRSHFLALLGLVLACTAWLSSPGAVASAYGAPSTSASSAVEAKKAEQVEVARQMEQTRIDLAVQVNDYVELGKDIMRTKREISEITTELAAMDLQLKAAQAALEERVVELYRGDRVDLLGMMFTARTLQELWVRTNYLAKITQRDVRLINEVRLARSENLWLQEGLFRQVERLNVLHRQSDEQRSRIESDLAAQQVRAERLRVDLARLMWAPRAGSSSSGAFNPDTVISETEFRASGSMTAEAIQTFLDAQPGTLDTYRAKDHTGRTRTVAEMVAEAANAWGVNPKVILVKLQKEQSLLERRSPTQNAYDWAMGCGKADSRTFYQYKGFGEQVWHGAEKLAGNSKPWKSGISMKIDGSVVHPSNSATYSLFKYTPHFRGTMSFWLLYWRYFGDPLAG